MRPKTNAELVSASRARAIEAGARKITIMLPPETAAQLQALRDAGYAGNDTQCIVRALAAAAAPVSSRR